MTYPYGPMNPYFMGNTNPNFVVPTGNQDLDQLIAASQMAYTSISASSGLSPGFGTNWGNLGGMAPFLNMTDRAMAIAGKQDPTNQYSNPNGEAPKGDLSASAGGERSTGRRLMGAGATGLLAGGAAFAAVNFWNPAGWTAGAVVGVVGLAAAAGALAGYFW